LAASVQPCEVELRVPVPGGSEAPGGPVGHDVGVRDRVHHLLDEGDAVEPLGAVQGDRLGGRRLLEGSRGTRPGRPWPVETVQAGSRLDPQEDPVLLRVKDRPEAGDGPESESGLRPTCSSPRPRGNVEDGGLEPLLLEAALVLPAAHREQASAQLHHQGHALVQEGLPVRVRLAADQDEEVRGAAQHADAAKKTRIAPVTHLFISHLTSCQKERPSRPPWL